MRPFSDPARALGPLDARAAAALVAASADIALVLDDRGVIRDIAFGNDDLAAALDGTGWLGQTLAQTVVIDSRPKAEALLREAPSTESGLPPRQRHLNHAAGGAAVPVLYSALQLGDASIVALGRDLRGMAALQQQLIDAQQSIERDYARLRDMETRYRLIFQTTAEAALIVDAAHAVVDANQAARALLPSGDRVVGRDVAAAFTADTSPQIRALLDMVRAAGQSDQTEAVLIQGNAPVRVAATLFREDSRALFLLRLAPAMAEAGDVDGRLLRLVDQGPDGFVVTDDTNRILHANAAFLAMAELAAASRARDEPLERWLGRSGVDLDVLTANLRQRGSVRLFSTIVRGDLGGVTEVEVSAVAASGATPVHGFAIRNVAARVTPSAPREIPRSVEQLTELIGRVPLRDLVREATDVIERLAIEAALDLADDNRASAAEMLGLSRQSLYVKLRRYGLGDLADSAAS